MNRHSSLVLLIAVPGVVGLSACGGPQLDTQKLEPKIKQGVERQAGVPVRSVTCPQDVEIKAGKTFKCTAVTRRGDRATVLVTEQDAKGNVRYQVGG